MGGKSGTTTQSVSIPPEVLARYNSVNARAEDIAKTPFQAYGGQFVAPITATQQAGISNVSGAANMAQPYFQQAQQQQQAAYQQAMPYLQNAMQAANTGLMQASNQFGQAQGYLTNAASQGQIYGGQAYTPIAGALSSAQPYMQTAAQMTGQGLGAAAPLMGAAEGFLGGGTQAVNPQEFGQAQINKYMSPYMRNVVEAQQALQQQESAAQRSALNSQAIGAGAFGGDRAGIAQANLARQQLLANQATLGNLLQQGYGQAAGMFQQQQGVDLAAQQANRAAQQFGSQQAANLAQQRFAQQLASGQQMAGLGQQQFGQQIGQGQALAGLGQQMFQQGLGASQAAQGLGAAQYGMGAQQAGLQQGLGAAMFGMGAQQAQNIAGLGAQQQAAALQGAQAQIGAGTLEQQTQQAEATAQYQQFLQERGYPFQVAQFLANIAMGTGALSGSTTTTTQPMPFFSDRSLKKDVKEIGETHDGLPIYSFKYKGGDEQPRIGVMADEAREKHPDAVHRYGGIDAVDYEKIADRASEGGGVMPHRAGQGYAPGGVVSDQDLAAIIAMQKEFLGPNEKGGLYGQSPHNLPGGGGVVPQKSVHVARLQAPSSAPRLPESGFTQSVEAINQAESLGSRLFGEKGLLTSRGKPAEAIKKIAGSDQTPATNDQPQKGGIGAGAPAKINETPLTKDEEKNFFHKLGDWAAGRQYGGGVRPTLAQGGYLEEKVLPYQSEAGYGPEDVNEAESKTPIEPLKPGQTPGSSSGGSGLGNLASAIGTAGTIAKAGTAVAEFLPALFALLPSDERLKTDMKRVGQLDNGQPVYKYRFGKGPMQLGLSAQNVSEYGDPSAVYRDKDGFLMLDYDRATRQYGGGIRPAFQRGGSEGMSDEEYAIRTAAAEIARAADPKEALGVVSTIENRRASGNYGGQTYRDVVLAPRQFEPWATKNNNPMNISPEDPRYKAAQAAFAQVREGGVPEEFKNVYNFFGPASQKALGRADPEWGRVGGRDIGGSRFFTLDEVNQSKQLARQGGVKPSDEPRRQAAPAESTVSASGRRTTTVDGQPIDTASGSGKLGDLLTSSRFWSPVGAGLLAMASSRSPYLGGAALAGLGAGLAAMQPSESAAETIKGQQIANVGASLDLVPKSFVPINGIYHVILPGNRMLTYTEWVKAGKPTPIGGQAGIQYIEKEAERLGYTISPSAGTGQPAAAPVAAPGQAQPAPATGAPAEPAQPSAPRVEVEQPKPGMTSTIIVPQSAVQAAQEEEDEILNRIQGPARDRQIALNQAIQDAAVARRDASLAMTDKLNDLASPLASMASGQQITPGAFAKVSSFVANYFNSAIDQLGLPPQEAAKWKFDERGLTDYQLAEKAALLLTSGLAEKLDMRALGALTDLSKGVANPSMTAKATRELLATAIVENQRNLEEALFTQKYGQGRATPVGSQASNQFRKIYTDEMYTKQRDAVKDIMEQSINGVPLINYLLNKGDLDPALKGKITPELINKKYGFDAARFFLRTAN